MATINQLETASTSELSSSDLLPIYKTSSGSARKLSLSGLISYFQTNFTSPSYTAARYTPSSGETITLSSAQTTWVLLRPVGTLATLTIVLPGTAVAADGQEILVTTTEVVTSLTVNGNGASEVNGAPSSLADNGTFKLRYDTLTTSWYAV